MQLTCVYRNKPQRATGTPFYEVRMFPPADKIRLYPGSDVVVSNPISNIRPDGMLTKRCDILGLGRMEIYMGRSNEQSDIGPRLS